MKQFPRALRVLAAVLLLIVFAIHSTGCDMLLPVESPPPATSDYQLKVYVLDVGQGDSILLASGGQYMLVDAGENDKGDIVVEDLKKLGVTKLAAVVGTHPHSDHIGGLDTVIKAFPVDKVYLSPKTSNTETYEDLLNAIDAKGLHVTVPEAGDTTKLGQADLTFLWPTAGYDSKNENNCSIVIRAVAGGRSVLLTGDIESAVEKEILKLGETVSCDVLKVAHHGSDTSTTKAFLKAVQPGVALISVGYPNDYHHPDDSVVKRLVNSGAEVHRTDRNGIITVTITAGQLTVQDSK